MGEKSKQLFISTHHCRAMHRESQSSDQASEVGRLASEAALPSATAAALQVTVAEALRSACSSDLTLSLCTLRILLTSSSLRKQIVPSALQVNLAAAVGVVLTYEGGTDPQSLQFNYQVPSPYFGRRLNSGVLSLSLAAVMQCVFRSET